MKKHFSEIEKELRRREREHKKTQALKKKATDSRVESNFHKAFDPVELKLCVACKFFGVDIMDNYLCEKFGYELDTYYNTTCDKWEWEGELNDRLKSDCL